MLIRDKQLIEKVGKYYLAYRGDIDLDRLLTQGLENIEINEITKYFILSSMTTWIVDRALAYLEQAIEARLTYREFVISYDREPMGAIDLPRSIPVMSRGIYAYYTYIKGYDAPEYAIMNYLLKRIYSTALQYYNKIKDVREEIKYFRVKGRMKTRLDRLRKGLSYFKGEYFRPLTDYDPEWLRETFNLYYTLSQLKELSLGISTQKAPSMNKKMLKVILWKLYELYVFFIFVKYLEREGFDVAKENGRYVAKKGNRRLSLILNSDLDFSQLDSVDDLDNTEIFRGRPDLSLVAGNSVLVECKYSSKVGYITSSRFKLMAYAYEYNPLTAILIYPGLDKEVEVMDSEEKATYQINEKAKEEGFVDINFKNSKKLYIVVLNPADDDETNEEKIARIFTSNSYLSKLL
ncbi:hypothetical protein HA72_1022 [Metallosphaera sedula]|uniref:Uncharacterized protein n=3 Tax=Metallosphaera TaxID=41980 RepID=A4YFI8_METS5|nr:MULTISPECIES: hypothetical protein [Metallosphaera]ABP95190.1 hypothetical protein Msed_1022 [Metallosphaera sedula DSM 5348]AIM27176.1 hypothetical protein HA72_1022 [Metallosphaera sedula]AKV74075.1 hypothetical protein MsedA_1034 [Metallosphaera sedula]AKV76315.1 hypothetical protein MsedB_1036 [Metallosphaera sedula]AKV78566.1 hypothetical protein MsedC_1034 [Metallosphaera sedula]